MKKQIFMSQIRTGRKKIRDNLTEDEKAKFAEFEKKSKVDHTILNSRAFLDIKSKFKNDISEGPTYICDICWKKRI